MGISAHLSNTPTNLCIALYCILLYCVVLNCIVLLIYCYVDIIQYNGVHKFVGVLDNPQFLGKILLVSNRFCADLTNVSTKKDINFAILFWKTISVAYAISWLQQQQIHQLLLSVAFVKPVILQENLSNSFGILYMYVFTRSFLQVTEIITFSFTNNVLKKWANGKAFYITGHSECPAFRNIYLRMPSFLVVFYSLQWQSFMINFQVYGK